MAGARDIPVRDSRNWRTGAGAHPMIDDAAEIAEDAAGHRRKGEPPSRARTSSRPIASYRSHPTGACSPITSPELVDGAAHARCRRRKHTHSRGTQIGEDRRNFHLGEDSAIESPLSRRENRHVGCQKGSPTVRCAPRLCSAAGRCPSPRPAPLFPARSESEYPHSKRRRW